MKGSAAFVKLRVESYPRPSERRPLTTPMLVRKRELDDAIAISQRQLQREPGG